MRQRYVVTYDIRNAKRLRKVFKILKGHGDHLQFSVFRCDLSRMQLVQLKMLLVEVIHAEEDQVLFVDVGPSEGRGAEVFESLGKAYEEPESGPVIV